MRTDRHDHEHHPGQHAHHTSTSHSGIIDPSARTCQRGLSTEVPVGPANGLGHESVVSCDNIVTIPKDALGQRIGYLLAAQEPVLTAAIHAAFDLE